jgi:hypothetical protein
MKPRIFKGNGMWIIHTIIKGNAIWYAFPSFARAYEKATGLTWNVE